MSYQRLAYDDADPTATMRRDGGAAAARMNLTLPIRRVRPSLADRVLEAAPSIRFEDLRERPKPTISIDLAAARLATTLYLG